MGHARRSGDADAAARAVRGGGRAPPISGEYVALRPSMRPSGGEVHPPSGRYGAPPESHRVLDEVDFDTPSQSELELEDGYADRARSRGPTSVANDASASHDSRISRVVMPPPSTRSISRDSSRTNAVVVGFFIAIGVASILAGLWVVVALLSPT